MEYTGERGSINVWLIAFIFTLLLFFGAAGFGFWAFSEKQDYKENSDQKAAAAVKIAKEETSTAKDKEFFEKEKNPLQTYQGPPAYGSLDIQYPKTWGAYVVEQNVNASSIPVDGYLHPNFVPGLQSGTNFALRVQVISTAYDQLLKQFENATKLGKVKVSPYSAPNVKTVVGSRIDGEFATGKQGSVVLLPLRDKTLKIWTEANQFTGDFNNIILPNLKFVP